MPLQPDLSDHQALDLIWELMSKTEWTPDTLDTIADVLRSTGREILDLENDDG